MTDKIPLSPDGAEAAAEGSPASKIHQMRDVRVEADGVQMFVSSQPDHTYSLENIAAGERAWQCVGSWSEETIQDVARSIGPARERTSIATESVGVEPGRGDGGSNGSGGGNASAFERAGTGRALGSLRR